MSKSADRHPRTAHVAIFHIEDTSVEQRAFTIERELIDFYATLVEQLFFLSSMSYRCICIKERIQR